MNSILDNWIEVATEDVNTVKIVNFREGLSLEIDIIPGDGYAPLQSFDDFEDCIVNVEFFNAPAAFNYKENYRKLRSSAFNFVAQEKGNGILFEEIQENYYDAD